jgi:energy-coupling factor transport system permease protein
VTGLLLVAGVGGIAIGLYGLLDRSAPVWLGFPMLALGAVLALAGLQASGRRVQRTVYRPDPWHLPEMLVAGSGLAASIGVLVTALVAPMTLDPALIPLTWPDFAPIATVGILLAALPAWLSPPVARPSHAGPASETSVGERGLPRGVVAR